jgi:drug/metabolite transporter (DMT)-like permease
MHRMRGLRGAALVVVWSSGFIGAELGARYAGPDTALTWRCLVTAVVLLPWLPKAVARLDRREWGRQAVLALLCQCGYLGGVFWAAAAGVPAGTSALIASLQPALVLIAAVVLDAQRLRVGHLAGLALGTTGVALTAAGDLSAGVALPALSLPLLAMLSLTAGTLLQQRWSAQAPPLMPVLAVQAFVTAGVVTAYTAAAGHLAPAPTPGFWFAVVWAVEAGIGSYALYYLVTTRDGAARASTLLYLTPATAALWAALMFGQPVRAATVLGLLVCGVAVVLLLSSRREGAPRRGRAPGRGARGRLLVAAAPAADRHRVRRAQRLRAHGDRGPGRPRGGPPAQPAGACAEHRA